jgi:sugar-specific transcriptional regulator TrmB
MPKNKNETVLEKLGLTTVQSKVFIANFSLGKTTAKQIARQAKIAREDVYRVMPSLQQMGLVKKHITKPALFETIDMSNAIKLLIDRRKNETEDICNDAQNFLKNIHKKMEVKPWINFEDELILLSNNDIIDLTISNELEKLKKTLEITVNWKCHQYKAQFWAREFTQLIEKGIKVRIITNMPEKEEFYLPNPTEVLMHNPKFNVRYIEKLPDWIISIYDGNRGFIFNSNTDHTLNPPVLWTSNSTMLGLMQSYFETTWNSAKQMSYPELCNNYQ